MNKLVCVFLATVLMASSSLANNVQKVVNSNNDFSNKLFSAYSAEKPNQNLFVSPISVHTLLALLYQGAGTSSVTALAQNLNLPSQADTATGYKSLVSSLLTTPGVTLNSANKVYVQKDFKVKKDFINVARKDFNADAEELNFVNNVESAETINKWVENKTNDKIHELISPDSLGGDTRMVLVNAIYFKGKWLIEFDKKLTKKEDFYTSETQKKPVDMMYIKSEFRYKESQELDAQILELPYVGDQVSMIIVLPRKKTGIKSLESKLTNVSIDSLLQNMWSTDVHVKLPKFKLETEINLKPILVKMGLEVLFSDGADFSEIADTPLKISSAIQKAFIEVNEEGTEAAAATDIGIELLSLPLPVMRVTADHPFLVYILQKGGKTQPNSTLFMGKIEDITQND